MRNANCSNSQEVLINETQTFHITPEQKFLNVSVWLTGVSGQGTDEAAKNVLATSESVAATEDARPSGYKFSLGNLLRPTKWDETAPTKELNESRIAYANISLAQIASDCHLNSQRHHISTYLLFPADVKASLG